MRRDDGGEFWDTVFDVVSLAFSVVDAIDDVHDTAKAIDKISDGIDGVTDITKTVMDVGNAGETAFNRFRLMV